MSVYLPYHSLTYQTRNGLTLDTQKDAQHLQNQGYSLYMQADKSRKTGASPAFSFFNSFLVTFDCSETAKFYSDAESYFEVVAYLTPANTQVSSSFSIL